MSCCSTCCVAFVLFLNTVLVKCIENNEIQVTNRTCIPAEALPSLNLSYCQPLYNFTKPFCKDHGIKLDDYVYHHPDDKSQYYRNNHANLAELEVRLANKEFGGLLLSKCKNALVLLFCRNYYPSCDATRRVYQEKKICRESCLELLNICGKILKILRKVYLVQHPWQKAYLYCKQQPYRNAGKSPECWYYTGDTNFTKEGTPTHCLYLNGSSYQGNISITVSGTPCQSWTAQCPHRHTMNTTYPELNKAKNYCRNPQNSGKRPWCFTTDRYKRWEYCDISECIPVDGNYGNWSLSSQCNVSCGQGVEIWRRSCNNPTPRYDGKNCSHLGNSTEYRQCTRKPCPVNGGYGNWTLSSPCSVSCGKGFEIWKRFCDNPTPRNGGSNCSVLGNSTSIRQCTRKPCPIDGNYGNWTKSSPCTRSCGKGFEIWTRECNDPLPKHGGDNCTKQGPREENRVCNNVPCAVKWNVKMIGIITGAGIGVIVLVISIFVFVRRRRRRKKEAGDDDYVPYAVLNFDPRLLRSARPGGNSTVIESPSHGAHNYQNFTSDGKPSPGLCRGIVKHQCAYVNILESIKPWYTKLQLLPPITIDWLRNAWGNVDEFGRHAYDVLQRVRSVFTPYNKLKNVQETDNDEGKLSGEEAIGETSTPIYNTFERSCEA